MAPTTTWPLTFRLESSLVITRVLTPRSKPYRPASTRAFRALVGVLVPPRLQLRGPSWAAHSSAWRGLQSQRAAIGRSGMGLEGESPGPGPSPLRGTHPEPCRGGRLWTCTAVV